MEIREIFLDRGKVMEFQTFPIIVFSCWLKSKEIWKTLCQSTLIKHQNVQPVGYLINSIQSPLVNFEVMELD